MKKLIYALASVVLFATACNNEAKKETVVSEEKEVVTEEITDEVSEEGDGVHFGRFIEAEGAVTVDDFSALMKGNDTINVKLQAIAADVCQKKGCWMKVKTADGSLMRVRFKDYGFFVPKDLGGKEIVFEGIAFNDTTSVEDLRHFAEDGGKSPEEIAAIIEPEINTSFLADGVVIVH